MAAVFLLLASFIFREHTNDMAKKDKNNRRRIPYVQEGYRLDKPIFEPVSHINEFEQAKHQSNRQIAEFESKQLLSSYAELLPLYEAYDEKVIQNSNDIKVLDEQYWKRQHLLSSFKDIKDRATRLLLREVMFSPELSSVKNSVEVLTNEILPIITCEASRLEFVEHKYFSSRILALHSREQVQMELKFWSDTEKCLAIMETHGQKISVGYKNKVLRVRSKDIQPAAFSFERPNGCMKFFV